MCLYNVLLRCCVSVHVDMMWYSMSWSLVRCDDQGLIICTAVSTPSFRACSVSSEFGECVKVINCCEVVIYDVPFMMDVSIFNLKQLTLNALNFVKMQPTPLCDDADSIIVKMFVYEELTHRIP